MAMIIYCGIVGVHVVGYFVFWRHVRVFGNERTIFLYHLVSFVLCCSVFALRVCYPDTQDVVMELLFVAATHGIYSLSFLELWSLSEGGYSLRILTELEEARKTGRCSDLDEFERIGDKKKHSRLGGLQALGMLRPEASHVTLTKVGSVVAQFLGVIAMMANVKNEG
jgi:hypothetical protein